MINLLQASICAGLLATVGATAARADWSLASVNVGQVANSGSMESVRNVSSLNSSASIQAVGAAASFTATVSAPTVPTGGPRMSGAAVNAGTVSNTGVITTGANIGSFGSSVGIGAVGAAASVTTSATAFGR